MEILTIIDAGHGVLTPGKRSPEEFIEEGFPQLFEWEFNRDIANRTVRKITNAGLKAVLLTPEEEDVNLETRKKRVRNFCKDNRCLLISIHGNAGPRPGVGTGFEAWTLSTNRRTEVKDLSDLLASELYFEARKSLPVDFPIRTDFSDGDPDKEAQWSILKVPCPAVLSENLFFTNKRDLAFMQSNNGRETISDYHANAVKKFISKFRHRLEQL